MAERFVKVPTELVEAMYEYHLTVGQYKALLYIIRKTYGWGKTSDVISIARIATKLEDLKIIEIERSAAGKPNTLRIKPVTQWTPVTHGSPVTRKSPQVVTHRSPQPVTHGSPTIDTLKDNIKESCPSDRNPWDEEDTPEELEAWLNS